ncbi:hypothetical protein LCR_07535 [Aeromonas enteropelogenes]|uniref:Uncharacterized protein n=1 Tax=Aeromonas enteropelogenes TaxID=29489 RepID=A0A175VM13_AEREN|nr:hypothetical protein LCR_07535 [Aeromonas enteropelogenes]
MRGGQYQRWSIGTGNGHTIGQPAITTTPLAILWVSILIGVKPGNGITDGQAPCIGQCHSQGLGSIAGRLGHYHRQTATLLSSSLTDTLRDRGNTKRQTFTHHVGSQIQNISLTQGATLTLAPHQLTVAFRACWNIWVNKKVATFQGRSRQSLTINIKQMCFGDLPLGNWWGYVGTTGETIITIAATTSQQQGT